VMFAVEFRRVIAKTAKYNGTCASPVILTMCKEIGGVSCIALLVFLFP
jgi:hypothetical protein